MSRKVLTLDQLKKGVLSAQYAVRGAVPTRANQIAEEISSGSHKYPFDEVLYCNIGNPQSVGQPYIKWYRNILSLVDSPHLLKSSDRSSLNGIFGKDCVKTAEYIVNHLPTGTGAYSNSAGEIFFRQGVSDFIEKRDGYPSDPKSIFLSNGASTSITYLLNMVISSPNTGIFVPVPQYPIYSALIALLEGTKIDYSLDEDKNWGLDFSRLQTSLDEAKSKGVDPKVFVMINPGNPTGSVLSEDEIRELVIFCKKNGLMLMADEVYQENIYNPEMKFVSAKKVVRDLGPDYADFELVSFHSTSKGIIGECGRRGGYMEVCGLDEAVFDQLVKLCAINLCSNLDGQLMTYLMCKQPKDFDFVSSEAQEQFDADCGEIFQSLKRKAAFLQERLNSIEGISCANLDGAMYAFPKISIPNSAIEKAKKAGLAPDAYYALSLLEKTGICCVPGSGFGQEAGTFHLRMTFLPEEEKLKTALDSFEKHHLEFVNAV